MTTVRPGLSHFSSITLILGGARSGKSGYGMRLAEASGLEPVYVATAQARGDAEMAERIRRHQQERSARWRLVEEPFRLGGALAEQAAPGRFLLVDCLTLWLTNLLLADGGSGLFEREKAALLAALRRSPGPVALVGNETGLGVIPLGAETRRFVDENGRLHQELAAICQRVTLVVAGLPMELKGA